MLDAQTTAVNFVDLRLQSEIISSEVATRLDKLRNNSAFILGPEVRQFEEAFARFIGAAAAIGVASGTDALLISLKAAGITEGDEVVTAANSFVATAEAIAQAGATPVFVDVDPQTCNVATEGLEAGITPRTRALIPVHLYGQPAAMDRILDIARAHSLKVIEDACQAHGARLHGKRVGALGDAGAFSFYPGKNLGAWGDGGAVVTNDPEIAEKVRLLRSHGEETRYHHVVPGYCSRLDSIQAAVLSVKLKYLDEWNAERRRLAALYDELLDDEFVVKPTVTEGCEHVFHLYVIRVTDRDGLRSYLADEGIQTGIHYPVPIHLTPAFCYLGYRHGDFPVAEKLAGEILSLPIYPELAPEKVEYVCEKVNAYVRKQGRPAQA